MKAVFEVRSIKSKWKPPFTKDITDDVFEVEEGEGFDRIIGNGNDSNIYQLVKLGNGSATITYSKLFTLKTGNPGNYKITLIKDTPVSMTYLWGEDGITKTITFKGNGGKEIAKAEENNEAEEQLNEEADSLVIAAEENSLSENNEENKTSSETL